MQTQGQNHPQNVFIKKILPDLLEAGYLCALSGKWHLGMSSDEYLPSSRGFQQTYGHMNGGIDLI